MGGLTVATALTLIVVPAVYPVMETLPGLIKNRLAARKQRKYGDALAGEEA